MNRMMSHALLALALSILLSSGPPALAGSDPLERILHRYIEAVGGQEAIEDIASRTAHYRVVTDLRSRMEPVYEVEAVDVVLEAPDRYRVVQAGSHGNVQEGSDGETAWKIERGIRSFGLGLRTARMAWLVDLDFPLRLREYFPHMVYRGPVTMDGRSTHLVDISGDRSKALYFDEETGLLVRLGYNRELRDYRKVDGVLLPFEVSLSRKGGSTTFYLELVRQNRPVDPAAFVPPGGPER